MSPIRLDDVDRGILHALQQDARSSTAAEMGETVGVSASTVRNRIQRLEEAGVITGYNPDIDYEQANYQLHVIIVCRAPPSERSELADRVMDVTGVVTVRRTVDRNRKPARRSRRRRLRHGRFDNRTGTRTGDGHREYGHREDGTRPTVRPLWRGSHRVVTHVRTETSHG